jgi:hypothetical protein
MKPKAAGDEATPKAQNAEMSKPTNIRKYTRLSTAFV